MRSQNEVILEHRVAELELVVHRLEVQLQRLATAPPKSAPAPPPAAAPKRYTPPDQRTVIHEKKTYDFFAKLPDVRVVTDFRATNHANGETLRIDGYSITQVERACRQFSRLQFISRRHWKGNRFLYGVARKLFSHAGAIQQHKGSRVWHWAAWPHERRAVCARIVEALSPKK